MHPVSTYSILDFVCEKAVLFSFSRIKLTSRHSILPRSDRGLEGEGETAGERSQIQGPIPYAAKQNRKDAMDSSRINTQ